jgi:phosphoglycolate phosphatase-like HAD superfamily hydrolase
MQVLGHRRAKFRPAPLAIKILHSQHERAVARAAAFLRAPKGERMAGVQIAGRRRRKAAAIGNLRFQVAQSTFQSEIISLKSSIPKRLLLFDIDGTLINSGGAGIESLKEVLRRQFGVIDDLRGVEIAGKTDTGIVHQILRKQNIPVTEETTALFLELYLEFLADELPQRQGALLPGVAELLPRLQARPQNVLALLTGNLRRGAQLKLAHYGIWGFFEFGAFADDHHDRNQLGPFAQQRARQKHAIDFAAGDIDVIGDTPHDIACGKAIGARTIAVTTGSFSRVQLAAYQPDWILDDFSEVDAALTGLGW